MDSTVENFTRIGNESMRADSEYEADLKQVSSTVAGRRLLWRILELDRVLRSSFLSTGENPMLVMAYDEGRKELGRRLYGDLRRIAPKSLELMLKENKES